LLRQVIYGQYEPGKDAAEIMLGSSAGHLNLRPGMEIMSYLRQLATYFKH